MGSSSQMFLTYLLTRHNVPVEKVSVTSIGGGASAVAAIERARVDAGWVAEPTYTLLKRRIPDLRVLADLRDEQGTRDAFGVSSYPSAVLYASGDWLQRNRDTAARLSRAIVATLQWMQAHSEAEIAAQTPAALRGEDLELYVQALKNSRAMFGVDGVMPADGAAVVRDVLSASMEKVRAATIDLSKTYTNEFVERR
jgi:NitT/TauT family transport system substrate-binding protein